LFSRATNRCPLIEVWLPSPISFLLSKGYMKDKKPLLVEWFLKWSRDRDVLLLKRCQLSPATSGFCPDSQNGCSDGAKI
jgi:hypothetical protein